MFLPPSKEKPSVVDVIARWTSDANYAPIVRQGNCVLIGIPVPSTRWTEAYGELIREMCLALHERKLEAYSTAHREVTKPGTYEFKLAKRGSIDPPFTKTFYFHFTVPKRFSARLEHAGSDSVMLIFMGDDEKRTHWTRKDARQQETLKIATEHQSRGYPKTGRSLLEAKRDQFWSQHGRSMQTDDQD